MLHAVTKHMGNPRKGETAMDANRARKEAYRTSVKRAMQWILSHQEEDGGFGPVERMVHNMVMGATLLYTGHADAAARLMPYLKQTYVGEDGNFDMPETRAGRESALLERYYAPSWQIYSTHLNLAFDISLPAMPHLLKFQDPVSGGMFGTQEDSDRRQGIVNTAVTSVAGQAALTTGYIAEARRMGDHLTDNLLASNPDLNNAFYPVWDTERGLRTDPETPSLPNMPSVLLRYEPDQGHFLTGMMIGLLTDLYRAVGERKYLDGALQLFEFAAGGTPAIYETTLSHKFAWGCAWLYRVTGQAEHLEAGCRVCDRLVASQDEDGSFVYWAFVDSSEDWLYSPRLGITAQWTLWISRILGLM